MLAIAGAKGGCGKTTTTLGLAAALSGRGVETLAIDCDRQMPDLHVWAGVDSEPTIAALGRDRSWRSVASEAPGTPGVYVLPGPAMGESVEIDAVLEDLDTAGTQVLLDCASGAGQDVVEPLSVADGVLIVSTGTEQSLDDAATTVDQARRLDVPIHGVVLTHCESVPEGFERRFDVPVAATIPEYGSPLADEEALSAYDDLAGRLIDGLEGPTSAPDRLETEGPIADSPPEEAAAAPTSDPENGGDTDEWVTKAPVEGTGEPVEEPGEPVEEPAASAAPEAEPDGPSGAEAAGPPASDGSSPAEPSPDTPARADPSGAWRQVDGIPTGIAAFDAAVGGLPPGSIVVLEADAASQSAQLLHRVASTRGTLYLTTACTEPVVRERLRTSPIAVGSPTVRTLQDGDVAEAAELVSEVPAGSNVVVDAMAPFERADRETYLDFLNGLKQHLLETGGIAVCRCLHRSEEPDTRPTTKQVADAVWSYEVRTDGTDRLAVPKLGSNGIFSEPLALDLDDRSAPEPEPPQ